MSTATAGATEVRVPDIGDFSDVPVIEVHVAAGDQVAVDDPIVTLESDKATMDVPAPVAGTVGDVLVGVGDRVSEGDLLPGLDVDLDDGDVAEVADVGDRHLRQVRHGASVSGSMP